MPKRNQPPAAQFEVDSLRELLESQDEPMRALFAKALNLFVAPGAAEGVDREKLDRLRKAVDDSLT
jgi:hypothetical protein